MKDKRNLCVLILVLIVYVYIVNVTEIGCPYRFVFGIPCMGCGMTRAFFAVLKCDLSGAIRYHPLVLLLPVIFLLFIIHMSSNNDIKHKKIYKIGWGVVVVLFCIVYFIRLLILDDPIIKIQIKDGLIYKILCHLGKEKSIW